MTEPFIVAEVSKSYQDGRPIGPGHLCQLFESVINMNAQRGYRLHSFTLHRLMTRENELNETIIAVFELTTGARAPRDRFLTPEEVAACLQIAPDTLKDMISRIRPRHADGGTDDAQ